MAERDLSTQRPPPPAGSLGGWWLLAAFLTLTLGAALSQGDRRLDARESAAVLGAASLIGDGDLSWGDGDRARLAALGEASRPALEQGSTEPNRFDVAPLFAAWLAPWVMASPRYGAIIAVWLALAIAGAALAIGQRGRLGSVAPWWTIAAIWGSGAFASALRLDDGALVLALLTTGLALILAEASGDQSELGDMFAAARPLGTPRVVAAGLLLGLAAACRPWLGLVLFALPLLLARRGVARGPRLLAAGLGISLAAAAAVTTGALAQLAELAGLEPELVARNALTLLAGPRFGLLLVAIPAVGVLVGLGTREGGRIALALAFGGALLWLALASPFSWSQAPATLLGPLPLAAAGLWWLARNSLSIRSAVLILVVGQLGVAGAWSPSLAAKRQALLGRALDHLPWETTQPAMPQETETLAGSLLVRSLDARLVPTRTGALRAGAGRGRLLLASDAPLDQVLLQMSAEAPSQLEVDGAGSVETMYRPDGGVTFLLSLDPAIATHPDAGGTPTHWYRLGLELGQGGYTIDLKSLGDLNR